MKIKIHMDNDIVITLVEVSQEEADSYVKKLTFQDPECDGTYIAIKDKSTPNIKHINRYKITAVEVIHNAKTPF